MQGQPQYQQVPSQQQSMQMQGQPGMMMQQQPGMMMQQQPGMMQPGQQPMMQGMTAPGMQPQMMVVAVDNRNAYQKLMQMTGMFIAQKMDLLEVISGCEMANKYYCYDLAKDVNTGKGMKKGMQLFKATEQSDFCTRQFCRGPGRPMDISITHVSAQSQKDNQQVFICNKPCKLPMFCLCRPELSVNYVEDGQNTLIGIIRQPFQWCDICLEIYDHSDRKIMEIRGPCCQCGIFFPTCPCEQCQEIHFDLLDAQGEVVGSLAKQTKGCVRAALSDADNFCVDFPKQYNNGNQRALLMCATLFLDYMFFEDNNQNAQNHH